MRPLAQAEARGFATRELIYPGTLKNCAKAPQLPGPD